MLPLTKKYKFRIPNRLAIFAALMLVVTSLTGLGHSGLSKGGTSVFQAASDQKTQSPAAVQASGPAASKKNDGFKVSLFLFRNR